MADGWMRRLGEALGRGVRQGRVRGERAGGMATLFLARPCAVLAGRDMVLAAGNLAALRRRVRGPWLS